MRAARLAGLAVAAALASGCSLNRTAARVTAGVIDEGLPAVYAQGDAKYAREALPANLQLMEILLASAPGDRRLLANAAQGFCGYAMLFLEDEDDARASGFYLKGEGYALRALKGAGPENARKADAPALFWHTFCKASYINLNKDKPEAVAALPELEPAIKKLLELDPAYYHGGPHALAGAYDAMRPKMFGGDPERAKAAFERALAAENFLFYRYLYARHAAVAAQDAELFEKLLGEVLSAPEKEGDTRLPDAVAKARARKLLEKKDELF